VAKSGYEKDKKGDILRGGNGLPLRRYRIINSVQKINAVTIRDVSLPPAVDDFLERFAG
jgi:hypothetical protein